MIHLDVNKKLHGSDGTFELSLNLNIERYSFVALSGKSGSGKSTLLRVLAGLEKSDSEITVDGKIWQNATHTLSTQKREIGFISQEYNLFENMNIEENLLFVENDKELAEYLLQVTELYSLKNRAPSTLSGGQKQRVALCRAFMKRPKLLLMDEPLSALDPKMRAKLQDEILRLHKEFKTTTIMVSHDPSEIYHLATRVVVLEQGIIVDDGSAKDVLLKSSSSEKFSFKGELLEIIKVDVIYIAIVSVGQELIEVVITRDEAKSLKVGERLTISTKAFTPTLRVSSQ
jgi:molybdate transport system ATP-binding protein